MFGIRPWEWDRLTWGETQQLMSVVDETRRAREEN